MSFPSEETLCDFRQPQRTDTEEKGAKVLTHINNEVLTGASALTLRQSLLPVCSVTCLFFIWGFTYALTNVLNTKFQAALNISAAKAGALQGAYFGAYLVSPLTYSGWILRRYGYRWSFVLGLCVYGAGSLLFWPSIVYRSFPGICISLFIASNGLSTIENAAISYVTMCGPPRLSELRLMISGGVTGVGIVTAPLLASRVFFKDADLTDLGGVQWTYITITAGAFSIALMFFLFPIPEITDADMAQQAVQCSNLTGHRDKPLSKQYKLFFGVIAMFCYVGGLTAIDCHFINYALESTRVSPAVASDRFAIAGVATTAGRFLTAGLFVCLKPRLVVLVFAISTVVFTACAIGIYGNAGVALLTMVAFFESCLFHAYISFTLRGLGRHSKRGASWMVAAISGGAVFPAFTGLVADRSSYHIAMVVPLAAHCISLLYPIYLNVACTKELDGFRRTKIGYHDENGNVIGKDGAIETEEEGKNATPCPPV